NKISKWRKWTVYCRFTVNNWTYSTANYEFCNVSSLRSVSVAEGIACTISIFTIIENLVILLAIIKGPASLRKPPYWFIASLACADLLSGLEVIIAIFVPVGSSPLSRVALKGLAVVTFIASINSLLLVSFDRYLRIADHANYSRILTRKWILLLIAISWLISFVMFLVIPLVGWSCHDRFCCRENGLCICKDIASSCNQCSQSFVPFTKSYILAGVVYFLISVALMTGFYAALFRIVKEKTFDRPKSYSCEPKFKKRELDLAKTLVITLGVFVICWLPAVALFIADAFITTPNKMLKRVFDYALVPTVINSLLNPIIYSVRLPRMRQTAKQILMCHIFKGSIGRRSWSSSTSLNRSTRRKTPVPSRGRLPSSRTSFPSDKPSG
uniref:G-protein coupled receptors family 1 profile domain-containing protein n=1 Tax=Ciona savignyi TaxID=51511 RepID=H2YLI4_CIOSA